MEISDLITPKTVLPPLRAAHKKHLMQELARRAATVTGIAEQTIFDKLGEREKLGTTGVGMGIAIPHGKLLELDRMMGFFVRLERPIDFGSVDDVAVDLVFMLLAPEGAGTDHLKALAVVSRLLRDRVMCGKLRGTDSPEALYALLAEHKAPARH